MATENVTDIGIPAELKKVGSAEEVYVAPQWKLMWWKFRKHRMALLSVFVLATFYLAAAFCEFVAPYGPESFSTKYTVAPPTRVHIFDSNGAFRGPFVYGSKRDRDPATLRPIFAEDTSLIYPIGFFVQGTPYKLWGLFDANLHLFGIGAQQDQQGFFLLGADRLGRDIFSRIVYGSRISLSIGLVGVFLSLILGVVLVSRGGRSVRVAIARRYSST